MTIGPEPSTVDTLLGEEPLDQSGAPKASAGAPIQGRSLRQIAWSRLKRDRVAMAGGAVVVLLVLVAFFAPVIVRLLGHPPNEFHQNLIDPALGVPSARFGGISWDFLFGLEPQNGRDLFSRIVYGSRVSLLIAFFATLLSVVIGTVMGIISGYFGGWIDAAISRTMDVFLAFPLLVDRTRNKVSSEKLGDRIKRMQDARRLRRSLRAYGRRPAHTCRRGRH